MSCTGNILFTLISGQYEATTQGGTSLVVACVNPAAGVLGWELTVTLPDQSVQQYTAANGSTCEPMLLLFQNVVIDCGTVNFSLSSDLSACQSSSSSTGPSSSALPSSMTPVDPGVETECCSPVLVPATLFLTFSDGTGDCTCFDNTTIQIDYNSQTLQWEGSSTVCGEAMDIVLLCDSGGLFWTITASGNCSFTSFVLGFSCSPFLMTAPATPTCCSGMVTITVTE